MEKKIEEYIEKLEAIKRFGEEIYNDTSIENRGDYLDQLEELDCMREHIDCCIRILRNGAPFMSPSPAEEFYFSGEDLSPEDTAILKKVEKIMAGLSEEEFDNYNDTWWDAHMSLDNRIKKNARARLNRFMKKYNLTEDELWIYEAA